MNSLENSKKMLDNNLFEGEISPSEIEKEPGKDIENNEKPKEALIEKMRGVVLSMREKFERMMQKKEISFKKVVGKGVVSFTVVSVLMSSPQFNPEAIGAEEGDNIKNEQMLDKDNLNEVIMKLNREFSDFSDNNLEERIAAMHSTISVEQGNPEIITKDKLKKDTIVQFLKVTNNLSTKEAEEAYMNNKEMIDEKLAGVFGGDGKIDGSIDLLSEGGVVIKFEGDLKNIRNIPEALVDNLKEIKNSPYKFISDQILNMLVISKTKESAKDFIDKHTVEENLEREN